MRVQVIYSQIPSHFVAADDADAHMLQRHSGQLHPLHFCNDMLVLSACSLYDWPLAVRLQPVVTQTFVLTFSLQSQIRTTLATFSSTILLALLLPCNYSTA